MVRFGRGEPTIQTLLTIAGHDPSSGAGVTADLAVFAAHGFMGTSTVTSLTVQSTLGVAAVYAVAPEILSETLEFLLQDLPPAGVKVGMLASEGNVRAVAEFLRRVRGREGQVPVVLDPVMRSTSGGELLSGAGVDALRDTLVPEVDWITPNLAELGVLVGAEVRTAEQMEAGAMRLRSTYPWLNVVAKGGHLEAPDDLVVLRDGTREWLRGEKIASRATHGTGCAFASALLCGLVEGRDGVEASRQAKHFVAEAIRRAVPVGRGAGPMNLLWRLGGQ